MKSTRGRGVRIGVVLRALLSGAVVAASVAGFAPATAEQHGDSPRQRSTGRVVHVDLSAAMGAQSGSSGGRSGDFTTDGRPDILARSAATGQLRVYPHSGAYIGTSTFHPPITINHNWSGIRWIGQGDLTCYGGPADVVYVDQAGVIYIAVHRGPFNGTETLLPGLPIMGGFNNYDLIYTANIDGDVCDDVLARRRGTGDTYYFRNAGGIPGSSFLQPAQLFMSGGERDVEQQLGDYTGDGVLDLMFVQDDGRMGIVDTQADLGTGASYLVGTGWQTIDAVVQMDVNLDGRPDILGRRKADGVLQAYLHTGHWSPSPRGTEFDMLSPPQVIGYNWQINNVIT